MPRGQRKRMVSCQRAFIAHGSESVDSRSPSVLRLSSATNLRSPHRVVVDRCLPAEAKTAGRDQSHRSPIGGRTDLSHNGISMPRSYRMFATLVVSIAGVAGSPVHADTELQAGKVTMTGATQASATQASAAQGGAGRADAAQGSAGRADGAQGSAGRADGAQGSAGRADGAQGSAGRADGSTGGNLGAAAQQATKPGKGK